MKILPPATLGMLGGGQLGRFFVAAAHEMGYQVWVLDPDPHSPAGKIADKHLCAKFDDVAALAEMAANVAAVTTEFENINVQGMATLAERIAVRPTAEAVAICQNRIAEKEFLQKNGFPVGSFAVIRHADNITGITADLFPAILKVARFGYDGKGQYGVDNIDQLKEAINQAGEVEFVLEQKLPLTYEISVLIARAVTGELVAYPVIENCHRHGVLDISISPSLRATNEIATQATVLAKQITAALSYVGVLAVEFFVSNGRLLVNEISPRPHNSGHLSIDAASVDQFAMQVRCLCHLPLPVVDLRPAVMINLLGDLWFDAKAERQEPDWSLVFAEPSAQLHLYGKHEPRPGRKMGHITFVGEDINAVLKDALRLRQAIGITDD